MVRQPSKFIASSNDLAQVLRFLKSPPLEIHKDTKPRSPIFLGVKLNTEKTKSYGPDVKSYTKNFSSYIISDSTDATIIALGITSENVQDYKTV